MLSQNIGAIGWNFYDQILPSVARKHQRELACITYQNDLLVLVNVEPEIWNVPNDIVEELERVVMLSKHGLITRLIRSDGWKLWFKVFDGSDVVAR